MKKGLISSFKDLLKNPDFAWPAAGDRLFHPADPSAGRSVAAPIATHPFERRHCLLFGYRGAADHLVAGVIEGQLRAQEAVFPIVFCYRHYIELALKSLLEIYGSAFDVPRPAHVHDLKKLLRDFRRMMRSCHGHDLGPEDIAVSKCVLEFAGFDQKSFSFRYAADQAGEPYPVPLGEIDLARLRRTIDALATYFDATDAYIDSLVSNVPQEFESY